MPVGRSGGCFTPEKHACQIHRRPSAILHRCVLWRSPTCRNVLLFCLDSTRHYRLDQGRTDSIRIPAPPMLAAVGHGFHALSWAQRCRTCQLGDRPRNSGQLGLLWLGILACWRGVNFPRRAPPPRPTNANAPNSSRGLHRTDAAGCLPQSDCQLSRRCQQPRLGARRYLAPGLARSPVGASASAVK